MTKKIVLYLLAFCLSIGCATKVQYIPNPPLSDVQKTDLRVAVTDFTKKKYKDISPSIARLLFIPGYLYTTGAEHFGPRFDSGDLGKPYICYEQCLAEDLQSSQMFSSVDYFGQCNRKDRKELDKYDLIFSGKFHYDRREVALTAYGIGPVFLIPYFLTVFSIEAILSSSDGFGVLIGIVMLPFAIAPIPVFFLFPAGKADREIVFEIAASLPTAPDVVIWKKKVQIYDPESGLLWGIPLAYFKKGNSSFDRNTPELLRRAFLEVRKEIAIEIQPGGKIWKALQQTKS